jgi:hypothetical protein
MCANLLKAPSLIGFGCNLTHLRTPVTPLTCSRDHSGTAASDGEPRDMTNITSTRDRAYFLQCLPKFQ